MQNDAILCTIVIQIYLAQPRLAVAVYIYRVRKEGVSLFQTLTLAILCKFLYFLHQWKQK